MPPDDQRLVAEYAARLTAIVESSDDAIVSKDLEGVIRTWNQGAERLFGYSAEEAIGKSILILIPEDRKEEEATILRRIRNGERIEPFETVRKRKDGVLVDVWLTVSPVKDTDGNIVGASKIARDVTERRRLQEQQKLLVREMVHRLKNTLAIVQAVASQTLRSASAAERSAFFGRLQTLASAQDLLSVENWRQVRLQDLLERALAPFQRDRIDLDGPAGIWLDAGNVAVVSMALHELATNAAKYGALSNASGRVLLRWRLREDATPPRLSIIWRETGGPPVEPPAQRGFGSLLLDRAVEGSVGEARLAFYREGVACELEFSL
jgi:PAS domain S-box-containing protein